MTTWFRDSTVGYLWNTRRAALVSGLCCMRQPI